MKTRDFITRWFSPIAYYSPMVWTMICFVGTSYIILMYGILSKGLIALAVTLFFAGAIWAIPFSLLVLFSLYLTPEERSELPTDPS